MRPALRRRSRIEELALMSSYDPFCRNTWLTVAAVAAFVALTPMVYAQTAQQAALSGSAEAEAAKSEAAKSEAAKTAPLQTTTGPTSGNVAATDQANPPPQNPAQQKSLTGRAIDKVKEVAKSAGDIFSRVPCLPPKGGAKSMGSRPHFAANLAPRPPLLPFPFGTSLHPPSPPTSPSSNYPNR